ncbi:MAG: DUF2905 family protein [Planctomycetota bacterium]
MDTTTIGKWIVIAGLVLVGVGGLVCLLGRSGLPLGRLPGDIRISDGNKRIYIPVATSIILSILLTLLLNLIIRFFRK